MQSDIPTLVVASGFWQRFKGLMGSKPQPIGQALLIPRCRSVHTCFMRYPLDIVYLNQSGTVVKLVHRLKPWRLSWGGAQAAQVLEMTAGGVERHAIQIGDSFALLPSSSARKHAAQAKN